MKRVAPFVVVLVGVVLAACSGEETNPPLGTQTASWPKVECPEGSGITAEARLLQIEGWAPAASDAKSKAQACRTTHTGVNPVHCGRVFSAWSAANAAQNQLLSPEQKEVLWALCASELTHGTSGSGLAAAAGLGVWPDVECPTGSGISARLRLDEIVDWATAAAKLDAKSKAEGCLAHTVDTEMHRSRVYNAWSAAHASLNPLLSELQTDALWALCSSELTHGTSGSGGPGGG